MTHLEKTPAFQQMTDRDLLSEDDRGRYLNTDFKAKAS